MYCYILFQCCSQIVKSWITPILGSINCLSAPSLHLLPLQAIVNKAGRGPALRVCNMIHVFQDLTLVALVLLFSTVRFPIGNTTRVFQESKLTLSRGLVLLSCAIVNQGGFVESGQKQQSAC